MTFQHMPHTVNVYFEWKSITFYIYIFPIYEYVLSTTNILTLLLFPYYGALLRCEFLKYNGHYNVKC